ncbi:MAG: DUF2752 domain-containing protein [Clostridium sp.]|nr:DUF2752 domain-containing protein [Clostridium sp.]
MKKNKLSLGLLILFGGFFYYLVIRYTEYGIPCLFYSVTHLKCPGCGITRMLYECSLFHWRAAAQENYFLFFTSPILAGLVSHEFFLKGKQKSFDNVMKSIVILYAIALFVWMILRNIYHL